MVPQGDTDSPVGQQHVAQITSGNFLVPPLLDTYLRAIGPFIQPGTGEVFNIKIPTPGTSKSLWGKIDASTHGTYMTQCHPRVFAARIAADVALTAGSGPVDWTIPSLAAPKDAGSPTPNLLGWRRAQVLTEGQMLLLNNAAYDVGDSTFHRNFELLTSIYQALERLEQQTKMCRNVSQPPTGSIIHSMSLRPAMNLTNQIFDIEKGD